MKYDVIIIGGGPGGYVCALSCAGYGLKTALVEKRELGGTCLNRGCIPTKTLLFTAGLLENLHKSSLFGIKDGKGEANFEGLRKRSADVVSTLRSGVAKLLKQHKVDVYYGTGKVISSSLVEVEGEEGRKELETDHIVLATGGAPSVPPIPGSTLPGVYTSDSLLEKLPEARRLVIIGGGVIGVEFAEAYRAFGAEVTIVEMMPRILPPFDTDLSRHLAALFRKKGIKVITKAGVRKIEEKDGALSVTYEFSGKEESLPADAVLIATGRHGETKGLLPMEADMERGCFKVDSHFETSVPGIYAIGDIVYGGIQLAHAAEAEGKAAAAAIAGKECSVAMDLVPQCVYTIPEIAAVGISEDRAKKEGIPLKTSRIVMGSNAKSLIADEGGYMKLFADEENHILGGQLFCSGADNLISEISLAIANQLTVEDFLKIIRPHPSVEESLGKVAESLLPK
ncbi:dihydrolipoyl dehydrogenase [uncultured Dialister sp.]|uniref:dihydrolipoyl dehydrogenase n=1 Tax=uncultured Dialister sp. TaxID=278064 RepID=UPI002631FB28|nr:dihydrolipoyl dehydrogenase [uncultured Dialister sp.]